jgi:hypothetical protein
MQTSTFQQLDRFTKKVGFVKFRPGWIHSKYKLINFRRNFVFYFRNEVCNYSLTN